MSETDATAVHEIFCAAEGELYRRHGVAWTDPPAASRAALVRHLLAHDAERCFVAERDGRVVAFSAAFVRDRTWFLAWLFVRPEAQTGGLGRELLDRSWGEGYERRITITDSIQPISNGMYARRGLIPATPLLNLAGQPRASGAAVLRGEPIDPDIVGRFDRAAYGFDRTIDHAYWGSQAAGTLWFRERHPVAYSYARADGTIGPVAAEDPGTAAQALREELARAEGRGVRLIVPGSSRSLVEVALAAGLRFTTPPGLLLLSERAIVPRALAIWSFGLY